MKPKYSDNLEIDIISAGELTPAHIETWRTIQRSNRHLESPFFRPEYTQIVASVRDDVEIAVLRRDGEVVGYFPFHRLRSNVACPIGASATDYQGVVAGEDVWFSAEELMRGCKLAAWHFNHLVARQEMFNSYFQVVAQSPHIDIADGYQEFCVQKRKTSARLIKDSERKTRVIERELGAIRLEMRLHDRDVLNTLLDWKVAQYRRIKSVNHLAAPWQRGLLKAVWEQQRDDFGGHLSAFYAGDHLVAIKLGLRSDRVLHSWFSSYDRQFASYSPGTIMLLELLKVAESHGIGRVDLGRGNEEYKYRFMTGSCNVAEGSVDLRPVVGPIRRAVIYSRELVRSSPLRRPVQSVVRNIRSWTSRA